MTWQFEWGPQEAFLWETFEATGVEPKSLQNKPEWFSWMGEYIQGFSFLSSQRMYLFGPQPIQYSEIGCYADRHNISNLDFFEYFVCLIDRTYLEIESKRQESKSKAKPKPK